MAYLQLLYVLLWALWGTTAYASLNTNADDVTVTNRVDEVNLYSAQAPGNVINAGECFSQLITGTATWDGLTEVTFRLRYGSGVLVLTATPTPRTNIPLRIESFVCGNTSSTQRAEFYIYAGTTAIVRANTGVMTVDSSQEWPLSFSIQYAAATTGMSVFKDTARLITTAASSGETINPNPCGANNFMTDWNSDGTIVCNQPVAAGVVFTPTGSIAATNVGAAIAEVAAEAQPLASALTTLASKTPVGTGSDIRSSSGSYATDDCVKVDANGNLVTAGAPCGSGSSLGDVVGPASATDNALPRFDSTTGKLIQNSGAILDDTNNLTGVATITLPNSGLHLLDTNASHDLILAPGSDLTADHTLTITTGDADRTLTLSGNATVTGTNTGDQTITLTGDTTGSGTGSFATTIASGAVTNAKLANVATATIKGRTTAGTGDPEDLTATQATALLNTFTSGAKGLVPASGGGTTNFLRADGTFAAPAGGGGTPGGSDTQVQYNNAGAFAGSSGLTLSATQATLKSPLLSPDANNSALTASGYSLTGSNDHPLLDLAGTWNTTGTPTGIKLNVTDTASNSVSPLVDLQIGGVSKAKITKSGQIFAAGQASGTPDFASLAAPGYGFTHLSNRIEVLVNFFPFIALSPFEMDIRSDGFLAWSTSTTPYAAVDVILGRDSAGTLQFGFDSATPTAQTIKGPDGSGTNIAGAAFSLGGGRGTGTGIGGPINLQTAPAGSSGTSQNALVTRLSISGAGIIAPSSTATVDNTGALATKPHKSGTAAPGTCAVGETFFDTDATAGQNEYGCTATNTWTLQGDGAGGGSTTLDQAFDNGKVIDGANSEANAFQVTNGTGGVKIWTESGVTTLKVFPDQDRKNTIADNFDWILEQADGTDLLVADEATGVIAAQAAATIDDSAAAVTKPCRSAAGASPTVSGQCAYDSTSNTLEVGVNGANKTVAFTDSTITGNAASLSDGDKGDLTASSGTLTIDNNAISDAKVVDTITASNYLPLAGGTLTGQLVTDNLGIEFEESDTNPTCAAGNYNVYADTSEGKLKKCTNGTVSDLDTGSGSSAYKCGLIDCTAPTLGDFTGVNVASATTDTSLTNTVYLTSDLTASSGISINLWKKAAPSTPYTARACFRLQPAFYYGRAGMVFRESGTGKVETIGFMHTSSTVEIRLDRWDSPTTINGGPVGTVWHAQAYASEVCFQIEDDGTNRKVYVSNDAVKYRLYASYTRTTFLTADEIGFFVASGNDWDSMQARLMHWAQ